MKTIHQISLIFASHANTLMGLELCDRDIKDSTDDLVERHQKMEYLLELTRMDLEYEIRGEVTIVLDTGDPSR